MKKSLFFLLTLTLLIAGCKKNAINPGIVGKWNLSNVHGRAYDRNSDSTSSLEIDTVINSQLIRRRFDGLNGIYTPSYFAPDTIGIYKEEWTINEDATFIVRETLKFYSNPISNSSNSGIWQLYDNGILSTDILAGDILGDLANTNSSNADFKTFQVKTLTQHQLVLVCGLNLTSTGSNNTTADSASFQFTFNR